MVGWRSIRDKLLFRKSVALAGGPAAPASNQDKDRLRDFANASSDWTWEIGPDLRFTFLSDRFQEITGVPNEAVLGLTRMELGAGLADPDTLARYLDDLNHRRPFRNFEYCLQTEHGGTIYASVSGTPFFDDDGTFLGYRGTGTNVTRLKQTQLALVRSERLFRTLSATTAAVVRASSEQELLNELCRLIVEVGGYRMSWVGLAEQDEDKRVRPVASYGDASGYVQRIRVSWSAHDEGSEPAGRAIRTGQPSLGQAHAAQHRSISEPEAVPEIEHAANAAIPLRNAGEVFGAISFYSSEPDAFDAEELKLLSDLADNLAYGIMSLRQSAAAKLAEQRLYEAINAIAEGFVIYDKDDRLVLCNERYKEIYHLSSPVLVPGKTFEEVIRYSIGQGLITSAIGREEEYVRERIASHRNPAGPIVQELSNGRWLRIEERKTRDGGIVGIRLDITQLKNIEKHLRMVNEQLEQRVAERTATLAELNDRLLTAEEKSRTIIESAADGIIVLDQSGVIQMFSPAAQRMFGYTEAEVLGQRVNFLMPATSAAKHDAYLKAAEGSENPIGMDRVVWGRRSDGSHFPMDIAVSRSVVAGEKLYTGIVRDITERQESEKSLRESEFRLEAALKGADLGSWDIDFTTMHAVVNDRWAEMMGVAPSACHDPLQLWSASLHPADRERVLRLREDFRSGLVDDYGSEYRIITPDGTVKWMLSRGMAIARDEKGCVLRMVTTMQDITGRKSDEQKIAAVMARLQTLLSATPVVIYTGRTGGNFGTTYISPNVQEHMNLRPEQFINDGSFWLDNIHPDDRQRVLDERRALFEQGRDSYEYRFRFGDGSYHWLHDDVRLRRDDNGAPLEIVGAWMDITVRKNAEEKVRAADKAKSAFLANMSHEIRTPMNGVVGMVDILMQMEQPTEQRRMVQSIRNSSFSLLRIIDDILDASKIEAGKLSLEHIPVNLGALAEGAVSAILPVSDESRVRVILFVDPGLPSWIQSDPVRLRQVVMNLLSNAVKFSKARADQPIGNVSLRFEYLAPDSMRVVVRDNGIGMSREDLGNLFKPFSQAEDSTTRRFGGTGLGLVITNNLVDLMGGRIDVESAPGRGSTFTVTLPLVPAQGRELDPDISGLSLLALFDDLMNRVSITSYVGEAGARIRYAEDAEELAAMVRAEPDAIVLYSLPTMQENMAACSRVSAAVSGVRCLFFTSERSERLGMVAPNHYVVQRFPVLPSEFRQGLAILGGKASPELGLDASVLQPAQLAHRGAAGQLILLVEDNETNQEVICQQLKLLGYRAELAENGQHGLDLWRQGRYDLVLTDCHMPLMDGFEMVRAIREIEQAEHRTATPIIAITANALQGEAERCQVAGMDDYLSKPVELLRLSQMLKRWLSPEQPEAAAPTSAEPARAAASKDLPPRSEGPVVDPSAMTAMFGMENKALFRRLMKSFAEKAAPDVDRLQQALTQGAREPVVALAHKLKSSSRTIGGNDLAKLLEYIELQGRAGKLNDPELLRQEVDVRFKAVQQFIAEYTRMD